MIHFVRLKKKSCVDKILRGGHPFSLLQMLKQCHEYRLPLYHNQFAVGGNTLSILFFVFSLKMQSVNKELHQRFKESATKSVRSFLFKSRHKEQ